MSSVGKSGLIRRAHNPEIDSSNLSAAIEETK